MGSCKVQRQHVRNHPLRINYEEIEATILIKKCGVSASVIIVSDEPKTEFKAVWTDNR